MKIKSILFAIVGLALSNTAYAAWTLSGIGSVIGDLPDFTLTGANDPGSYSYSITSYEMTLVDVSTVSFDWSYSTADANSRLDPAGYAVDGIKTYLMNDDSTTGSGSVSVNVLAGSTFSFFVESLDEAQGPGQLTVANATIPEPSAFVLLGLGAVGLVARRRRSA